ncbi:phenylalanine 4-monooxygenase [Aeromicrobium sp. UC242_57]|uniref:phenylalanine 4-monooxygenase n=1 Tax=Aeromicrobium sp. UC242_57 TaxID=3374624 RepID=UPI0037A91425
MFDEGQYFAPVVAKHDGSLTVQLGEGHPGLDDPVYRERRDLIATTADRWTPGDPAPEVAYTDEEHEVWRVVCDDLRGQARDLMPAGSSSTARRRSTCRSTGCRSSRSLSDLIEPMTGFRYRPAAGLVPLREFYGALAEHGFWATQYVRHHSVPLYTPEPDVLHEVVGHGNTLADRRFTRLVRGRRCCGPSGRVGCRAGVRQQGLLVHARIGVVHEADGLKAYGAGILSSPGEIEEFRGMTIRPLDLTAMGTTTYDITHYQEVLFAASSFGQVEDVVGGFWDSRDDDSIRRLVDAA